VQLDQKAVGKGSNQPTVEFLMGLGRDGALASDPVLGALLFFLFSQRSKPITTDISWSAELFRAKARTDFATDLGCITGLSGGSVCGGPEGKLSDLRNDLELLTLMRTISRGIRLSRLR